MKIFILFCSFICHNAICQNQFSASIEDKLMSLASDLNGKSAPHGKFIYETEMTKPDVSSIYRYSKKHPFPIFDESYFRYLKFDLDISSCSISENENPFILGKVFISENYISKTYQAKLNKANFIEENREGFYTYCKLLFSKSQNEFLLIIYPDYAVNICDTFMHFNNKLCQKGDTLTHRNSVRALMRIDDYDYNDLNNARADNIKEVNKNQFAKLEENQGPFNLMSLKNFYNEPSDSLSSKIRRADNVRKNTLKVGINYSKRMKIFKILLEKQNSDITLTLANSKNSGSEDFSSSENYKFKKVNYEDRVIRVSDINIIELGGCLIANKCLN